jgi:GNAT superfamily N-acetyltransferase
MEPGYRITTDPAEIDHVAVWQWLHDESYWAAGRPREVQERAVAGSLCFGLLDAEGNTAGFARVVTDRATFAWLADVVVLPAHRGRGLGKALVGAVVAHPDVVGARRIVLGTKDAHDLYAQFGFTPLGDRDRYMERRA